VGIDTGKSEDEYCNFISVLPRFFQASETDLARLIMTHTYRLDWTAIKDRGYRPMIISTEYLDYIVSAQQSCLLDLQGADFSALVSGLKPTLLTPVDKMICASTSEHELQKFRQGNPKSLMVQRANAWVQILWDWFSILDRLWAGSITVAGSPAVKVGHKIGLANDTKHNFPLPMEFYVVGVSHNYDLERGLYLTTLNVTRGQPKDAFVTPSTNGVVDKIDAEQAKELGQIINKATHKKLEIQIERRPQP
jgi:hypothetical protein